MRALTVLFICVSFRLPRNVNVAGNKIIFKDFS